MTRQNVKSRLLKTTTHPRYFQATMKKIRMNEKTGKLNAPHSLTEKIALLLHKSSYTNQMLLAAKIYTKCAFKEFVSRWLPDQN